MNEIFRLTTDQFCICFASLFSGNYNPPWTNKTFLAARICRKENLLILIIEPVREKTNNLGFRPGLTQTGLYSHRRWLEAGNFVFK